MSVTSDKNHPRKNIADMLPAPTKKFPPLRKYQIYPKNGTNPNYGVSDATSTNNSHGGKDFLKTFLINVKKSE